MVKYTMTDTSSSAAASTAVYHRVSLSRSDMALLLQYIARAAHGVDHSRLTGGLELLPQVAHVDFDDVGFAIEVIPPGLFQDLLAREHPARIAQEQRQQVVLFSRQVDDSVAAARFAAGFIQHQVGEAQLAARLRLAAAQQGTHARQELLERERLGKIIVGAAVETLDAVRYLIAGGEHQDGLVAAFTEPAADLNAVDAWQLDI